jgi:hypothetical protein
MGLDLTPRDYLEMLTDEYREYRDNRLSMRKAINCCGLSNALPEVITAHHNPTDSPKDLKDKTDTYREQLRQRCEAHHTVRDFCEYSKHVRISARLRPLPDKAMIFLMLSA